MNMISIILLNLCNIRIFINIFLYYTINEYPNINCTYKLGI